MKIQLGGAVVAGLAAGALALAGPAIAQDDPAFAHGVPEVTMAPGAECGEVELTFTNPTPWLFVWDVRVDGEAAEHGSVAPGVTIAEGPLAGQEFGDRWTLVEVQGPGEVTETFDFTESVEVRLAEGAEQKLFHDWLSFDVEALECPAPTPTATASPQPTVDPTVDPSAEPSETPAPGVGGEQLPTTGVPAAGMALGGAVALAAGTGALWLFRRRRVSFQA